MIAQISACPFFVLRTPLLSYSSITCLSEEIIKNHYKNPILQEAIFIASPELYELLCRWLDEKDGLTTFEPLKKEKVEIALAKYLLRMSFRATPFGLFSGISVGYWQEKTSVVLPASTLNKRYGRLDMDFLCMLTSTLIKNSSIRSVLIYYPNNTLIRWEMNGGM